MKTSPCRAMMENLESRLLLSGELASYELAVTTTSGTPISTVEVGQDFQLRVYAEDLRPSPQGVWAGYLDVTYDQTKVHSSGGFSYGSDYPNGPSGSASTAGLLDEVGGFAALTPPGGGAKLLFSMTFHAAATGSVVFASNSADDSPMHDTLLFGSDDPVDTGLITYGQATVDVIPAAVSHPPVANDDSATVNEDSLATIIDVLANDTDLPNDPPVLTVTAVSTASHGTVAITGGGTGVSYRPSANFNGQDAFTYTITDNDGLTDTASVDITVTPVNDTPTVSPQSLAMSAAGNLDITLGASDVETLFANLAFNVPATTAHGTVTKLSQGQYRYHPDAGFIGTDSFAYTVTDTGDPAGSNANPGPLTSDAATVTIVVGKVAQSDARGKYSYTDADGDTVTVTVVGGAATLYFPSTGACDASRIVLSGTTDKSSLTIVAKGLHSTTTLGGLDASAGPLAKILATSTTFSGLMEIGGSANLKAGVAITLAAIHDGSIESDLTIKSITLAEWLDADATADEVLAPALTSLTIKGDKKRAIAGDFQADLDLGSPSTTIAALGSMSVAGELDGAVIGVEGHDAKTGLSVKSIKAGRVGDVDMTISGGIGAIATSDWLSGTISAGWLGSITSKANTKIAAAGSLGFDLTLTGLAVPTGKPTLGSAKVSGDLLADSVWDVQAGTVGAMTVTGTVRQSIIRSAGNIKSISIGATDGSDFGAGVAMNILETNRHVAIGDTANAPQATIGTFSVKGLKMAKGAVIPQFFIDSNISAKVGKFAMFNWDGLGGLFTITDGYIVKSLTMKDTDGIANNWTWPDDFVHII